MLFSLVKSTKRKKHFLCESYTFIVLEPESFVKHGRHSTILPHLGSINIEGIVILCAANVGYCALYSTTNKDKSVNLISGTKN